MTDRERTIRFSSPAEWSRFAGRPTVVVGDQLRLAPEPTGPHGLLVSNGTIAGLALPRRLTVDDDGAIYLLRSNIGAQYLDSWLWWLGGRDTVFVPISTLGGDGKAPREFDAPQAAVAGEGRLFVADTGNSRVQIVDISSSSLEAVAEFATDRRPVDVALGSAGLWVVGEDGSVSILRPRSWEALHISTLAPEWTVARVLTDGEGRAYVVASRRDSPTTTPALVPVAFDPIGGIRFGEGIADIDSTRSRFGAPPLDVDHDGNFRSTLERAGVPENWYDESGRAVTLAPDRWIGPATYLKEGTWTSKPIDSEVFDCRWDEVRLALDAPTGTRVTVRALAHSELGAAEDATRSGFAPWTWVGEVIGGSDAPHELDAAFRLDPGRFIVLHIELAGDGYRTPAVSEVQIEFPRRTWLRHLPAVFSEDPDSRSFLERFLAMTQSLVKEAEGWIHDPASLLDVNAAPEAMVEHIAAWLGVRLEPEWPEEDRVAANRALIAVVSQHVGRRGTVGALRSMLATYLKLLTGIDVGTVGIPVLVEGFADVPLARFGNADLGDMLVLSGGAGSCADHEPDRLQTRSAGRGHRFTVYVPEVLVPDDRVERILRRAIDDERPANTAYDLVKVRGGIVVGQGSRVGLTTIVGDASVTKLARGEGDDGPHDPRGSRLGIDTVVGGRGDDPIGLQSGMRVGEAIR